MLAIKVQLLIAKIKIIPFFFLLFFTSNGLKNASFINSKRFMIMAAGFSFCKLMEIK